MDTLYRSSDNKVIADVCAGIAYKLDFNVTGLRWATAIITLFFTGLPAVIYLILWIILKERPTRDRIDR